MTKTRVREVHEPAQGYGRAIQRGLREATGDPLVLSEPDGTFLGRDVVKILAYSDDFVVVFGSRTTQDLVRSGAKMGRFLRLGNSAVAEMTEWIFNTRFLSDVGCTMRLFRRPAYERIPPHFTVGGSHFGPEAMLLVVRADPRFIEVPVNCRERVGESGVTGRPLRRPPPRLPDDRADPAPPIRLPPPAIPPVRRLARRRRGRGPVV